MGTIFDPPPGAQFPLFCTSHAGDLPTPRYPDPRDAVDRLLRLLAPRARAEDAGRAVDRRANRTDPARPH